MANDDDAPNRIRELREAIGLSQQELARLAHITPSALNKVENGTRGLDLKWIMRLAPLLSTPDRPVVPADLLPRAANPYSLDPWEKSLYDARRAAEGSEQEKFKTVAEAILPFGAEPADQRRTG